MANAETVQFAGEEAAVLQTDWNEAQEKKQTWGADLAILSMSRPYAVENGHGCQETKKRQTQHKQPDGEGGVGPIQHEVQSSTKVRFPFAARPIRGRRLY